MATATDSRTHFDETAADFDAIYTGEGVNTARRVLDRVLRYDIFWRYDITMVECDESSGASVLDI